jgi:plastocyanin
VIDMPLPQTGEAVITLNRLCTPCLCAALAAATSTLSAATLTGKVTGGPEAADSIVYVTAIPGKTFAPPAAHVVIDQRGIMFRPHVIVAQRGQTVDFHNSDRTRHNIFWDSVAGNEKLAHNLGTWPTGQVRSWVFTTSGIVPLGCNVHPQMSAFLMISPTPYFATTGPNGTYNIANIPPGTYTVKAWHEGMKTLAKRVTIPKSSATLDFVLKAE